MNEPEETHIDVKAPTFDKHRGFLTAAIAMLIIIGTVLIVQEMTKQGARKMLEKAEQLTEEVNMETKRLMAWQDALQERSRQVSVLEALIEGGSVEFSVPGISCECTGDTCLLNWPTEEIPDA